MLIPEENPLGTYLRDRRAKLDPASFGIPALRRRTPGLRREEVAQRANVSATWYTWLEQGRGGAPSADVLDRIADALALTGVEREHLFLLAQNRPPEVRYEPNAVVTPQLQRVLDSLELCPTIVHTMLWYIVAWNEAAAAVLTDYAAIAPEQRNVLRMLFGSPHIRARMEGWESFARSTVATFRANVIRAGASQRVKPLVDELIETSTEFAAIWSNYDVADAATGSKHFHHPVAGPMTLEYSSFAVDGQPDLGMVVYTPATSADRETVRSLIAARRTLG